MKKRSKLIMTIASLSLALAIMVFGVYAATTATFSVTSKVEYTVSDVFVVITATIYKGASGSAASTSINSKSYTSYTGEGAGMAPKASTSESLTLSNGTLDTSVKGTKLVITVVNNGNDAILVTDTNNTAAPTNMYSLTITKKVGSNNYSASDGVAAGSTYTYTAYTDITDLRKSSSVSFNIQLVITKK